MDPTKIHELKDLDALYRDAEDCDKDKFAHFRSNILLISGDHYNKRLSETNRRIQSSPDLRNDQKLRITQNHTQRIIEMISSNILSAAPGVSISPKNQEEIQDQKAAELHHSIWRDAVDRYGLDDRTVEWCDDFSGIGEVATKIFWDKNAGPIKAFSQKMDPSGQPLYIGMDGEETTDSGESMGMQHAPAPGTPVYWGAFVFEDVYGFNLLRDANAKRMDESEFLVIRKMVDNDKLKAMVGDDPDKQKLVTGSMDETYMVFDTQSGAYRRAERQTMVKEFYFRPCVKYPKGYFFITVKEGILFQGELPGGIFPIAWQYFRRVPTDPRGYSMVKILRPYQAEINRSTSKMAEHQVTLGDDKILTQHGTKFTQGEALPGVRAYKYTGMAPVVLEGRSGAQYAPYLEQKIAEMYQAANMPEETQDQDGPPDAMALLFRAASQKKRYLKPTKRFEKFLKEVCKIYLALAKVHLPDDMVIWMIGRNEQVNIAEYKNSEDLGYVIKVEAQSEDIETKMGRQMVLSQALQYVGQSLDKNSVGRFVRAMLMPYEMPKDTLDDLTMNPDTANNILLALDRGEMPQPFKYEDQAYILQRLGMRMGKPDFKFLPPNIQQNYAMQVNVREQLQAQIQAQLKAMEADYIPIGGTMVACDVYVNDPANPQKTPRRARIPYQALEWLMQRLEQQGSSLDKLEGMSAGMQSEIQQAGQPQGGMPMEQGASQPMGMENPGGVDHGSGNPAVPIGGATGPGYR